jgi:serine protease Do
MKIKTQTTKSFRNALLASAMAFGVAGYATGQSNVLSFSSAHAEAVKVQAPAAFSFGDVVEAVSPAVLSVRVEQTIQPASAEGNFQFDRRGRDFMEKFFEGLPRGVRPDGRHGQGPRKGNSQGSGFFVSDDGYLVTNNHVIEGGSKFTVVMSDGKELEAALIGTDPRTDLAVLKVESDEKLTYVDFGEKRPRTGDWVVAVGNPFGLGGTVTAGIVSAHGRDIGSSRYDDFIQIDAAVNKGNSGGPTFNLSGEVIGVNTAIFSPSGGNVGIAFAVPAKLADEVVTDLIQNGSVTRGWLGVQIQPVTAEISESLGLDTAQGAIVTSPQEGSPAADAGIQSGDVITAVDDKSVKGPKELARVIAGYDPDSQINLKVWRDDQSETVSVTLGKLEETQVAAAVAPQDGKKRNLKRLGLQLEETSDGLAVLDVNPGSQAAERGLVAGDVIVSVNGEDVTDVNALRSGMKSARQAGRKSALLEVRRQDRTVFIPVPVQRG